MTEVKGKPFKRILLTGAAGNLGRMLARELAGLEAGAGDDDVHGPHLETLVQVVFLAQLRGREDVDLVAPLGALADLLGGPDGFGVERLGRLVDMGPFQHGVTFVLGMARAAHGPYMVRRDIRPANGP